MATAARHDGQRERATAADTRERILDAAAQVMETLGLARATTKQIARAAGYSEATLYKHFSDKTELLLAVLGERLPALVGLLKRLPDEAGQGVVAERLEEVAGQAVRFYERAFPILSSLFADPTLLARYREGLAAVGAGPHRANEALAAYLRAERELGRVDASVDPEAGAAMLLGACFQRAFLAAFDGEPIPAAERARLAARLVGSLLPDRTQPGTGRPGGSRAAAARGAIPPPVAGA
jgi:AcrR family transcriptional regulator